MFAERAQTCSLSQLAVFLRHLGVFVGSWASIIGFLGSSRQAASSRSLRSRLAIAGGLTLITLLFAAIFYSRQTAAAASPQAYLYLEVGGTLLCYCYAANGLVRFRGTHDRTALILSFGFALSGIIETIGYFGLNDALNNGTLVFSTLLTESSTNEVAVIGGSGVYAGALGSFVNKEAKGGSTTTVTLIE